MSIHRERVLRGKVQSEHLVQLFDEPESLVSSVAAFVHEGWKRGDHLLVVARAANWALTAVELEALGCSVGDAAASGRLVVLDASTTMAGFMVNGAPHPEKFAASVGELVHRLAAASPAGLTIYGEMVDVLVAQGNFEGAEQLEALWNGLSEQCSFQLLCGYASAHFGDERTAKHLHAICSAHNDAAARATDLLATWLLSNRRSHYHTQQQ
jgi:hypothetical protein